MSAHGAKWDALLRSQAKLQTRDSIRRFLDRRKPAVQGAQERVEKIERSLPKAHEPTTVPDSKPETFVPLKNRVGTEGMDFDESQERAIQGLLEQKYAVMIGAAGTGKTTVTRALVEALMESVGEVRMALKGHGTANGDDSAENYYTLPSICICAFTGRAVEQTKRNFDPGWHPNMMTIHRMLAFAPVWEERQRFDGSWENVRRYRPRHNAQNPLPWEVIIIDEAGMLSTELWETLRVALREGTRIILIGDINQLQPVTGLSVLGHAMAEWPVYELKIVHRQVGASTLPILDAAHAILQGKQPEFHGTCQRMVIPNAAPAAGNRVLGVVQKLMDKDLYHPFRDMIITGINGDADDPRKALGQIPLNNALAPRINPISTRHHIDAGTETRWFGVGDRVMATKNNYDLNVTNGMTGKIVGLSRNPEHQDHPELYGTEEEIRQAALAQKMKSQPAGLDEMFDSQDTNWIEGMVTNNINFETDGKKTDERFTGPSSHIAKVDFHNIGTDNPEHKDLIEARVRSDFLNLRLGYASTCHKCQGGEYPFPVVIIHDSFARMITREWLYTAMTRAQEKVLFLMTDNALRRGLQKQEIKGDSTMAKVEFFRQLVKRDPAKRPILPSPQKMS